MKTKEELNALKEKVETLSNKLSELSEEELSEVVGGSAIKTPEEFEEKFNIDIRDIDSGREIAPPPKPSPRCSYCGFVVSESYCNPKNCPGCGRPL